MSSIFRHTLYEVMLLLSLFSIISIIFFDFIVFIVFIGFNELEFSNFIEPIHTAKWNNWIKPPYFLHNLYTFQIIFIDFFVFL